MIRYTRNKKLNLILLYTFIEIINHNPSNKIHPKFYSTYYIYVLLIPYKRSNSHERSVDPRNLGERNL